MNTQKPKYNQNATHKSGIKHTTTHNKTEHTKTKYKTNN